MGGKNGWYGICMVRSRNKKEGDRGSGGRGFEKDEKFPEVSSEHWNAKLSAAGSEEKAQLTKQGVHRRWTFFSARPKLFQPSRPQTTTLSYSACGR